MNKIDRLLAIILKLNQTDKVTAQELADYFEVNVRTIYRDIDALSQMDIPIITHIGKNGGYSLLNDSFLTPIIFNREEIFTLLLSEKLIQQVDLPGFTKYVNSAFLKIKESIKGKFNQELDELKDKFLFEIKHKSPPGNHLEKFDILKSSLAENYKIKVCYFNPHKLESTERVLHPYGLIFADGGWYIVAFCEMRESVRWFRLYRIKKINLLKEKFKTQANFNINDLSQMKQLERDYKSSNSKEKLLIKVSEKIYHIIKEYNHFKYSNILKKEDGEFLIEINTSSPEKYFQFAFDFYDGLEIVSPKWLRKQVKDELINVLKKYK